MFLTFGESHTLSTSFAVRNIVTKRTFVATSLPFSEESRVDSGNTTDTIWEVVSELPQLGSGHILHTTDTHAGTSRTIAITRVEVAVPSEDSSRVLGGVGLVSNHKLGIIFSRLSTAIFSVPPRLADAHGLFVGFGGGSSGADQTSAGS